MANLNEQIIQIWDEWEATTGKDANNPEDFITWAIENKKIIAHMQDLRRMLRRQVSAALRQVIRMDDAGFTYRAKQCVRVLEGPVQIPMWFDTDKGGTADLRQKSVRQRRDGIANQVYRAVCDVEHMSNAHPGEQLTFLTDFSDDCAEHRAMELAGNQNDEDHDAPANDGAANGEAA